MPNKYKFAIAKDVVVKLFLFVVLVCLALGERLWFDMGWNVELVTVGILLTSTYLGRKWSMVFLVLVMGVSDLVLGNTNIWWFTWSAFLVQGWVGKGLRRWSGWQRVGAAVGMGMGASIWFYVWTNLGVWWLDSFGMYRSDLWGLMQSYINGLPFLKVNLQANVVIVPMGFVVVETSRWVMRRAACLMKHSTQLA